MGYTIKGNGKILSPEWLTRLGSADRIAGESAAYSLVPLVYRAFRLRCDSLASVPVRVYKDDTEVDWPFICDPYRFIWLTEASLMMAGASYAEIASNRIKVRDLVWRNPFSMSVDYSLSGMTFSQTTDGKTVGGQWVNTNGQRPQMLYIAEYDPLQDVLPGVGAVKVALEATRLRHYLTRFASHFFEDGAMPVVMLGMDQITPDEAKRVEKWFGKMATGIRNAWNTLAVKGKVTATVLTPPLNQMAMPELYEQSIQDIAWSFGMNKAMLTDTANFATAQEYGMQFWQGTIRPRGMMIESALNTQVFKPMGLRVELAFDELDVFQQDEAQRAGSLQQLVTAGFPLLVAADILGYDLSEEQLEMIEAEQIKKTPPQLLPFTGQQPVNEPPDPVEPPEPEEEQDVADDNTAAEMKRWERFVVKRMKDGKTIREFETEVIHPSIAGAIVGALENVRSIADVHAIFANAHEWRNYP